MLWYSDSFAEQKQDLLNFFQSVYLKNKYVFNYIAESNMNAKDQALQFFFPLNNISVSNSGG